MSVYVPELVARFWFGAVVGSLANRSGFVGGAFDGDVIGFWFCPVLSTF